MKILISFLAFVEGCVTQQETTLAQFQPWRIYPTHMSTMFDAVRSFSEQENFLILRFDVQAGRILAHKWEVDSAVQKSRSVMMAMAISMLDSSQCLIDARFNFANEKDKYTPHDEQYLLRHYHLLFDYVESFVRNH